MTFALTFDAALRFTEILLALAFIQQSVEHLHSHPRDRWLFLPRIGLSFVLLFGVQTSISVIGLCLISLVMLHRFNGPYNGGSDRMSLLILWCLLLAHCLPSATLRQAAFAYLAIQLTLSYFISGWVKLANPEWRSGRALRDVFAFSAYPVAENLRALADRPVVVGCMAWLVILFEVLFPLSLISQPILVVALCGAAAFHLANAFMFGLNRFFWIWLAAYPSLLWFQDRFVGNFW